MSGRSRSSATSSRQLRESPIPIPKTPLSFRPLGANHPFERTEVSRDEALALGKKGRLATLDERPEPSKFKLDIIENYYLERSLALLFLRAPTPHENWDSQNEPLFTT